MVNALLNWIKDRWYFFTTFFPVQLFMLQIRRSHLLIIFWLLLFGFVGGHLANNYGLRYLFLTPEYLDKVNFFSFFIVGITSGLFVMAFHISSYIYYSYRYPFLATLSRPLWKFSLNNSLIPVIFYLFYLYHIIILLVDEEFTWESILLNIAGLLLGSILIISFSFTYFIGTIRTLELPEEKGKEVTPVRQIKRIIMVDKELKPHGKARINYYMRGPFSIKLARDAGHYGNKILLDTIQQHQFSASIYFVALILMVIGLSLVSSYSVFMIPAGATIFLIFSLYLMITGAFYTRLKTWTVTVGVLVLLGLNFLSGLDRFKSLNYAYGMNYNGAPANYSYENFDSLTSDSIVKYDRKQAIELLNKWKKRNSGIEKPKLIILNVSGGGQRSALWTMKVLQEIDKATNGKLYNQVHLITGSSGGMLGAAFFREVKYRYRYGLTDISPYSDTLNTLIGKDLLNPVTFTMAVNDLFFRLKDVQYGPYSYPIDRGYAFDKRLDENTMGMLNRKFKEYKHLEEEGEVPWMVLGPTIVGDGRKMLMSTQGISYLTYTRPYKGIGYGKEFNAVEFSRLFEKQDAQNLSFLTALRMSASFPYITPLINMPSKPDIQLIDAGVRDNEGFELTIRYIFAFKKWIEENTSGVLVIQIKANRPNEIPIRDQAVTKLDKLVLPIGGVLKSFHNLQIYNKSLLMELSRDQLNLPVEVFRFSLLNDKDDVSLSWHLTNDEKHNIARAFHNDINQASLKELIHSMKKSR